MQIPKLTTPDCLKNIGITEFSSTEIFRVLKNLGLEKEFPQEPYLKEFFLWQCWRFIELQNFHLQKDSNEKIKDIFHLHVDKNSGKVPRLYIRLAQAPEDDGTITIEWVPVWGPGKSKPWKNNFQFCTYLIQNFWGMSRTSSKNYLKVFFKKIEGDEGSAEFHTISLFLYFQIFLKEIKVFYFGDALGDDVLLTWKSLNQHHAKQAQFICHVFDVWKRVEREHPIINEIFNTGNSYQLNNIQLDGFEEIIQGQLLKEEEEKKKGNKVKYKRPFVNVKKIDEMIRHEIFNILAYDTTIPPDMNIGHY